MSPTAPKQYFQGQPIDNMRPAQAGDPGYDPARGMAMMLVTMPDGTQQVVPTSSITGESGEDRKTKSGQQGAAKKSPQHESPSSPVVRDGDRTTSGQRRKKAKAKRGAKKAKKASRSTSRKKRL